jgi:hypothetical protein
MRLQARFNLNLCVFVEGPRPGGVLRCREGERQCVGCGNTQAVHGLADEKLSDGGCDKDRSTARPSPLLKTQAREQKKDDDDDECKCGPAAASPAPRRRASSFDLHLPATAAVCKHFSNADDACEPFGHNLN